MKSTFSRREFVCSGACAAAAFVAIKDGFALGLQQPPAEVPFPVRLGLASYTFRNFSRAQLIGFMKQLNVFALNPKDRKLIIELIERLETYEADLPVPQTQA